MPAFRFSPSWFDVAESWDRLREPDASTFVERTSRAFLQLEDYLALTTSPDAWTAFTTTWSGTLGNGVIAAAYVRLGKTVLYRISVQWGSTTSHGAGPQTFTLPVKAYADWDQHAWVGRGGAKDADGGPLTTFGDAQLLATDGQTIVVSTGNASNSVWSASAPFTWATGDIGRIRGFYEAA